MQVKIAQTGKFSQGPFHQRLQIISSFGKPVLYFRWMMRFFAFSLFCVGTLLSQEVLVFPHIPKCGGTTVASLIGQKYYDAEVCKVEVPQKNNHLYLNCLPEVHLHDIAYIYGHVAFRSFSQIPDGKFFTFLRDPVQRVFSHYRFCLENMKKPPTFMDFYKRVSNFQVRYLSSLPDEDETITLEEHLESAKANLREYFFFVGITEEMQKSMRALYLLLDWDPLRSVPTFNTTRTTETYDPNLVAFVEQAEWADRELYVYGKELLEEFVEQTTQIVRVPKQLQYVDHVHFTVEQPLDGEGWGHREIDLEENRMLRQSYKKEATIRFPLQRNNYVLEVFACSPPNHILNQLEILVNGKKINSKRCSNSRWSKFKGVIPRSAIHGGKTTLTFKVPELYVPSNHLNVPDHRRLGVGISEIIIKRI